MARKGQTDAKRAQNAPLYAAQERIARWRRDPRARRDKILNLVNLGLDAVPDEIRGLNGIQFLNLSGNNIRELPEWIGELDEINVISLSNNRLTSLPSQIGSLGNLLGLAVGGNDLATLPKSLIGLHLVALVLEGNPRLGIPDSVLKRPPYEILSYYFESQADAGRPLLELKLLLVGRGKSGKTTLD